MLPLTLATATLGVPGDVAHRACGRLARNRRSLTASKSQLLRLSSELLKPARACSRAQIKPVAYGARLGCG